MKNKVLFLFLFIFKLGTSQNENIHSKFSAFKPAFTSRQTLESINLMLNLMILDHNRM